MHYFNSKCKPSNDIGDSCGTIKLKNAFQSAIECSIMPTQTVSDTSKSLLRKHKELNLQKILFLREILLDGTEDLIEMHDCYR